MKTALFFAEVNVQGAGRVEVRYDAMEPEQISVGRWVGVTGGKRFDIWTSFPAENRSVPAAFNDPLEKADFAVRSYELDATVTSGAEFSATTKVHFETRWTGEGALVFALDSNLRVDKVLDPQGRPLTFFQAREQKDRNNSYGTYVVIPLPGATVAGSQQTLEFHYSGNRVVRNIGNGNYFCQSFDWYPVRMRGPLTDGDFDTLH